LKNSDGFGRLRIVNFHIPSDLVVDRRTCGAQNHRRLLATVRCSNA
jgi:hypothetical protein